MPLAPTVAADRGDYWISDLGSADGTWVNGRRIPAERPVRLLPADRVRFGQAGQEFVVRMLHNSLLEEGGRHGGYDRKRSPTPTLLAGLPQSQAALSN